MPEHGSSADNFMRHIFYHGTHLDTVEHIVHQGFRVWFSDEDGERYCSDGNLGTGIYITCNWRTTLWFGSALLRIDLRLGTRLLDASVPPDPNILAYLRHEFGHEILSKPPWQALPRNKQLTLPELINLFRLHYQKTWEKHYGVDREGFSRWPRQRNLHAQLLANVRSLLLRDGFHGYGNPDDDNGIVVFAAARLILKELITELPPPDYAQAWPTEFRSLGSLADVRTSFMARGSERAKRLAEQIAAANAIRKTS